MLRADYRVVCVVWCMIRVWFMSVQKVGAVNLHKYRAVLSNRLHLIAVKIFSADGVVSVRVTVRQSMWLLIPEEYESRDIFCCHQPITCKMKCHGKFCNLCQSLFSNLWWPSTVEAHSLLVLSLCWLLSASTKLSRLAAGISGDILGAVASSSSWDMMAWVRVGGSYGFVQFLAFSHLSHLGFSWLTNEYNRCRGCILDPA